MSWNDLAAASLWDGIGLGGSQKCEVAYLDKEQIPYEEIDVMDFASNPTHASCASTALASSAAVACVAEACDESPSAADAAENGPEFTMVVPGSLPS